MSFHLDRRRFLAALHHAPENPHARAVVERQWPTWMPRMAASNLTLHDDVLLVIFLRGAADALSLCIPYGEERYYALRPTIAIPRPQDASAEAGQRAIDLDGFFGLHPAMKPLMPAWHAGHLSIVHACGSPDDSRSHFQAMELMERGLSTLQGPASGWINRHLAIRNSGNPSPLRAVGLGEAAPRSLRGQVPVSALQSVADFHLVEDPEFAAQFKAVLRALDSFRSKPNPVARRSLELLDILEALDPASFAPSDTVHYPETNFGLGLRHIALLIRAEVGLEAATLDLGGWDTHFAQGGSEGWMAGLLSELSLGLAALVADLEDDLDRLTVVVMSEFGRRVKENASFGTDHGHGGLMLILGGNVVGGVVHTAWPGLAEDRLYGPGDLAVTIDYREVLAEICARRLNNPAVDQVFPDFKAHRTGFVR